MSKGLIVLYKFFKWNYNLSMKFDSCFMDESYTTYGTTNFHTYFIPTYITDNALVYDIGGGKCPHIFPAVKAEKNIKAVGVDIDADELSKAPEGGYDDTICADITQVTGAGDGDFVISRATLEHVKDAEAALKNMASFLKPGGRLIFFAPGKNAWFARLNMILPEGLKNKLINYFYDESGLANVMGFKAYYDRCTPAEIETILADQGMHIVEKKLYYMSNYFAFFTPLYIIWRLYQKLVRALGTEKFCEGFAYVVAKPS